MVTLATIIDLPPDDEEAFLAFEEQARRVLVESTTQAHPEENWQPFWLAYMTHIREAAIEFGVEGFEDWRISPPIQFDDFQSFERDVLAVTTRLKFRVARRVRGQVVQLETSDREKIKFKINQLRDQVKQSELSQEKKDSLIKKIDELIGEFEGSKVNRGRVLLILTMVATLVGQAQGVVLKGPETVVAIMDSIGLVIGKEEERRALLERYRKPLAIEDRSSQASVSKPVGARESFSAEIDDEIPF